jgi:hypothetical protein
LAFFVAALFRSPRVPAVTKFHNTAHVLLRTAERGLTLEQLKSVVNFPDKKKQQYKGDNGGFVYKFEKIIDGKTVVAIAEVKSSECWLISGWCP